MSATSDEVLYEVSEGIATLTLNRPDRLNTISGPMLDQLTQLLLKANADPEVKVILLTGKGRAFCAGLDLVSATQGTGIGGQTERVAVDLDLRNTPPTVLFALDKPSICAMNGSAAGYGMDVALGCDIRIMAEGAKMAAAFVKRGIVPESGGTWYLPRMIGWAKAAELIFTGRTLTAAESLEMGLANHVVPDDQVQAKARALAAEIAAAGHAIAIHGDTHRCLLRLTPRALSDDLDRAEDTIGPPAGGLHRAPYGIYSAWAPAAIRRRGWTPLLWSRWGRDWRASATPQSVAAEVTRELHAGDVLLLHDSDSYSAPGSWRTTLAALPAVLDAIAAAGLFSARLGQDSDPAPVSGR